MVECFTLSCIFARKIQIQLPTRQMSLVTNILGKLLVHLPQLGNFFTIDTEHLKDKGEDTNELI